MRRWTISSLRSRRSCKRHSRERTERRKLEVSMPSTNVKPNRRKIFIVQQGLVAPDDPEQESILYSALQFQPRLIGALVLVGLALQTSEVFLAVGAALFCSAIAPGWNPFNALYNHT